MYQQVIDGYRIADAPPTLEHMTMIDRAVVRDPSNARRTEPHRVDRAGSGARTAGSVFVGPNWFATVMGTGIVAVALCVVPVQIPGLVPVARGVWLLAVILLVVIGSATARQWRHHRAAAGGPINDPVLAHYYGAPAMALLTVGAGATLLAEPLIGRLPTLVLASTLWISGTALGLWSAVAIPLRAFTEHEVALDAAGGPWLMSVVPPMVSAATGAALIGTLPAGQWQLTMLLACWAMFGMTLVASLIIIGLVWSRLMHHKVGPTAMVPTLWIPLGPVGQSITTAHYLGAQAERILPAPYGTAFRAFGLVYGMPMLGFGLLWLAIAVALTMRARREGMPFGLTWWSFTFPVGTMVTGCSALAASTGAAALNLLTVLLCAGLVGGWLIVARGTIAGVIAGRLFTPLDAAREAAHFEHRVTAPA